MKPYYDECGIQIYHGDCREILPTLPKCDLLCTDPPYGIGMAARGRIGTSKCGEAKNYGKSDWDDRPADPEVLKQAITQTRHAIAAIWLLNGRSERARKYGVLSGLIGQPFWYVQLVIHAQWLMVPVYLFYTASWLRGLWNHWIRPRGGADA